MLKAIIFDFNGIILNDEPLHFQSMRDAVARRGISITREEYWNKYLPLDDRRCLKAICTEHQVQLSPEEAERVLTEKSNGYKRLLENQYPLFPGAGAFVTAAAARYPLALASGARRDEIESTLRATNLRNCFAVVIGAEDFTLGKPHPESFLLALKSLNSTLNGKLPAPIRPNECVVVEDAVAGVRGAQAAGMKCLAVTNSYTREQLSTANRVVASLEDVTIEALEGMVEETA